MQVKEAGVCARLTFVLLAAAGSSQLVSVNASVPGVPGGCPVSTPSVFQQARTRAMQNAPALRLAARLVPPTSTRVHKHAARRRTRRGPPLALGAARVGAARGPAVVATALPAAAVSAGQQPANPRRPPVPQRAARRPALAAA
eukprot:315290-Chlamydomonas_euryale.AAC.6